MSDQQTLLKQQAAERAVEFVQSGMTVGLGTGSTAIFATRRIGQMLADGQLKDIICIATSRKTDEEARKLGIPLLSDDLPQPVDVTIDGADEIDPDFHLIKGGGGALLREKIVAQASSRFIVVADESKLSDKLGTKFRLPVEVLEFAWRSQLQFLESLGAKVEVRHNADGSRFLTDSGNLILDCDFGPMEDPLELAADLNSRAGIVEHGLFLFMTNDVIIAGQDGIRWLTNNK
ncbi:MAG TPA: ribose-5-phosphate isomerase RpiA [Blastocatellia bacterium]|nr:ribose-5-phosphate isomerase RpiA [Blastocatellia bacterium]HMV85351.1 ribose-5-phosphate isomerase RpiA [Blastocatellia bacterium]HMX27798.1 ribose-5-phosphate isomerase RpiA [Blastocatellia bacterium]HMZ22964.1 ribose-5-phosphate isomerase RpiA [Blastocatellia bacterium]HNG30090.1 ribose-5-phosphate isomerase RpiA [Blastocatellia bacterium]